MIGEQMAFFRERLPMINAAGVEKIWIDPGFGFALNLPDGPCALSDRQHVAVVPLPRTRLAGVRNGASSVCLFHDDVRSAETRPAALALLGEANLLRTYEVARVQPMIDLLDICV